MKKNSVTEFEMEKEGFKIRLKRGANGAAAASSYEEVPSMAYAPPPTAALPAGIPSPVPGTAPIEQEIKCPMIGTFYRSPSPESAPYVEVGTEVNPETVVCIVEAMKVMNEIKAEVKGVITQAVVENAKPVEFGQPLFKYRPA